MSFPSLVLRRQSTRDFSTAEVELEKLQNICKVARLSPSSCNSQPWIMHIVRSSYPKFAELRKSCQLLGLNKFLDKVNNFIVIEQHNDSLSSAIITKFGDNDLNSIDLGILAAHICLAAEAEGLGTCMIGSFRQRTIQQALDFDKKRIVRLVIAVGYPAENYPIREKSRKKEEDVIKVVE